MKEEERNKRPILLTKTKEEVLELYQMRNKFYEKSDVTIVTDELNTEEVCHRILNEINKIV